MNFVHPLLEGEGGRSPLLCFRFMHSCYKPLPEGEGRPSPFFKNKNRSEKAVKKIVGENRERKMYITNSFMKIH